MAFPQSTTYRKTMLPPITIPAHGRADPVWDIGFTTKFKRSAPNPDAELVQPKGALALINAALASREAELDAIATTCCCVYHLNGGTNPEHSSPPRELGILRTELIP